jgi:hypothetical protein
MTLKLPTKIKSFIQKNSRYYKILTIVLITALFLTALFFYKRYESLKFSNQIDYDIALENIVLKDQLDKEKSKNIKISYPLIDVVGLSAENSRDPMNTGVFVWDECDLAFEVGRNNKLLPSIFKYKKVVKQALKGQVNNIETNNLIIDDMDSQTKLSCYDSKFNLTSFEVNYSCDWIISEDLSREEIQQNCLYNSRDGAKGVGGLSGLSNSWKTQTQLDYVVEYENKRLDIVTNSQNKKLNYNRIQVESDSQPKSKPNMEAIDLNTLKNQDLVSDGNTQDVNVICSKDSTDYLFLEFGCIITNQYKVPLARLAPLFKDVKPLPEVVLGKKTDNGKYILIKELKNECESITNVYEYSYKQNAFKKIHESNNSNCAKQEAIDVLSADLNCMYDTIEFGGLKSCFYADSGYDVFLKRYNAEQAQNKASDAKLSQYKS